ncbi:hypothetical protein ACLOJK_019026 [Asimina triloba]
MSESLSLLDVHYPNCVAIRSDADCLSTLVTRSSLGWGLHLGCMNSCFTETRTQCGRETEAAVTWVGCHGTSGAGWILGVIPIFAWIDALHRLSADLIRWVRGSGCWYLMQVIDADSVFSPAAKLVLDLDQDAFDSVLLMDRLMLANPMLCSTQIDLGEPSDGMDADLQARALLLVTGSWMGSGFLLLSTIADGVGLLAMSGHGSSLGRWWSTGFWCSGGLL